MDQSLDIFNFISNMDIGNQEKKPSQEEKKISVEEEKEEAKPNLDDMFNFDNFQTEINKAEAETSNQGGDPFSFNFGEAPAQEQRAQTEAVKPAISNNGLQNDFFGCFNDNQPTVIQQPAPSQPQQDIFAFNTMQ